MPLPPGGGHALAAVTLLLVGGGVGQAQLPGHLGRVAAGRRPAAVLPALGQPCRVELPEVVAGGIAVAAEEVGQLGRRLGTMAEQAVEPPFRGVPEPPPSPAAAAECFACFPLARGAALQCGP